MVKKIKLQLKIQQKKEQSVHSDIEPTAKITCVSPVIGTKVTIALLKIFSESKS